MKITENTDGLVLVCDARGTIQRVVHNALSIANQLVLGQMLIRLVDQGSRHKLLDMLVAIKTQGTSLDWELNIPLEDGITPMQFGGAVIDQDLIIFGSRTKNGLIQLYEDLFKINNEQINLIPQTAKEKNELIRLPDYRDRALYDELSRLNNDLVTLQRELAKKNAELERLNQLKNQFLGMAAHDLRTPLSHILTYSEFLIDEASPDLSKEHKEFLSIIQSSSNFMLQLVNNLLDVAQIEAGGIKLNLENTDLIALVRHNISLNKVLAQKKQIELTFNHVPDLPPILIDRSRVEQVLNNLVSNAIKFSHPHQVIEVNLNRKADKLVISVKDQGQGIPPEQLEKLFGPFARTVVESTQGEKSTGLGLAIVKKIMAEHNGTVWVESITGVGSTFYLSMPINSRRPAG